MYVCLVKTFEYCFVCDQILQKGVGDMMCTHCRDTLSPQYGFRMELNSADKLVCHDQAAWQGARVWERLQSEPYACPRAIFQTLLVTTTCVACRDRQDTGHSASYVDHSAQPELSGATERAPDGGSAEVLRGRSTMVIDVRSQIHFWKITGLGERGMNHIGDTSDFNFYSCLI